jgi:hypothetical protein
MAREVLRRRAVVIAVVMAALSLTVWAKAGDGGPDVDRASITSVPASLDHALVRVRADAVANWRALQHASRSAFAGALAVLVALVAADVRRWERLRTQLIPVSPLLARRYSLVVRGPPSFLLS